MKRLTDLDNRAAAVVICSLAFVASTRAENRPKENPAEALEMPTVEVVGTTPLPGLGTPTRDVPANVQIYTSKDLSGQRQTNVTDYLEQNPTSITANAAQVIRSSRISAFADSLLRRYSARRRACRYFRMACASMSPSATW